MFSVLKFQESFPQESQSLYAELIQEGFSFGINYSPVLGPNGEDSDQRSQEGDRGDDRELNGD